MDQLLFHPRIVHLPLALAALMPFIVGGIALAYMRGWLDRRTWVIVVLLQSVMFGSALLAMNTGEADEERVEEIVAQRHIDAHEEAAELFTWTSAVVLALTMMPLFLGEGDLRNAIMIFSIVASAVTLAFGLRAGEAGGRLVYRYGAANAHLDQDGEPQDRIHAVEEYEDDADTDE